MITKHMAQAITLPSREQAPLVEKSRNVLRVLISPSELLGEDFKTNCLGISIMKRRSRSTLSSVMIHTSFNIWKPVLVLG